MYFVNINSQSVVDFCFLSESFKGNNVIFDENLMKSSLSIFSWFVLFISYLRNCCVIQIFKDFCLSSKDFVILAFIFRCVMHFKLFLYAV